MVLLVFAFLLLLAISFFVVLLVTRPSREQVTVRRRMTDLRDLRQSLEQDKEDLDLTQPDGLTLSRRITLSMERLSFASPLRRLLLQSNSNLEAGTFVLLSAGLAVGLAVLCELALHRFLTDVVAFVVGAMLPLLVLRYVRQRRSNAFDLQLPDAIDLMARALRAGHSIQQSLELIGEQSRVPLGDEFKRVQQQQRFGRPFREALLELGERVLSNDLHFMITAMLVQKETGGDLIEILDRTTEVIRERMRVAGEIRIYTAQGRLTGWILSLLPCIMLAAISFISPGYTSILFHDPLGEKLLLGGVLMILMGGLIIRRIVDVEV